MKHSIIRIRSRWLCVGFIVLPLVVTTPVNAADCNSQDLTMIDMITCAEQHLKRVDAELNQSYTALMGKIESADQKRLRNAEKAWIAFRDNECLYQIGGESQGGSFWPLLGLQCKAELTEARVKDIRKELDCPSFDLSCVSN